MRDQENIAKQPCSRRRGGQFAELTTPSAAFRRLRDFLLMPQPPLLFKEGNVSALKQSANSFTRSEWKD